ncbi:zinc ribbon domain-containing protein [Halolamina pelagica]|nr:zinc ribbon domain-containing protein [Halolamina pelagica]
MRLLKRLRSVVDDEPTAMWECRRCGETLAADTEVCPNCGTSDIACYRFS